jgi:hypothetical protein
MAADRDQITAHQLPGVVEPGVEHIRRMAADEQNGHGRHRHDQRQRASQTEEAPPAIGRNRIGRGLA